MKLSQLVNYRNQIKSQTCDSLRVITQHELKKILYTINEKAEIDNDLVQLLQNQEQLIYQALIDFDGIQKTLLDKVEALIEVHGQSYFTESYRLYENGFGNETAADVLQRSPNISDTTKNFYQARITRYVGWQHAAMILRPGNENFINDMVSCDPLYIIDIKHELLKPSMELFNTQFQHRLRPYVVREHDDEILTRLPNAQFGMILAYNFFNFRPLEVIKHWLTELFEKLQPGGILIMTFNDCDRDKGVMLVEHQYSCYTPGSLICNLAQTLGFEIEFKWDDDGPSTWLELRKPGTLFTLRGGQTLAKIMPK